MHVSGEKNYAIAVRDEGDLFLFMWVKHSHKGEFFVMLAPPYDVHASYHADGISHKKTHEKRRLPKTMTQRRQKPDQHFVGTAHLLEWKLPPRLARDLGQPCNPTNYTDVFEIPCAELREGAVLTRVSVDVVSPGHSPILMPDIRIIRQRKYQDGFPFIVVTLYAVDG